MTHSAAPEEEIFDYNGHRLKVVSGEVYRCVGQDWKPEMTMTAEWFKDFRFDRSSDGCFLRHVRRNYSKRLLTQFSSGFERDDFFDLFNADRWSHFTVMSPHAETVEKYVELRRRMLKTRKAQFVDNRIDIETKNTHSGSRALRLYAVRPAPHMVTSKTYIEKDNLCFGKGDDVWISGWLLIESGMPATLIDIETPQFRETPGMRVIIVERGFAAVELKWLNKIQYRQDLVAVPSGRWFELKLHLHLSNRDDGLIELWQDGVKIISTSGQTLPTYDSVYWMLEYGITATPRDTVVLADDLVISDHPL